MGAYSCGDVDAGGICGCGGLELWAGCCWWWPRAASADIWMRWWSSCVGEGIVAMAVRALRSLTCSEAEEAAAAAAAEEAEFEADDDCWLVRKEPGKSAAMAGLKLPRL